MAQAAIDTGDRPVTISIAAERILDTRTNLGLSGRFADGAPRDLQVTGSVPTASGGSKTVVPADAVGVLVNVTVVTPTHEGFLSLRPQGATGDPTTSTVNFVAGAIEPNGATVDLNNGQIQIWVETASDTGTADVLIDVVGYTIGHTHDDRYYTETEADAVHATKANSADVYTKTEVDALLTGVYTKAETDTLLAGKLDDAKVLWAIVNADGTLAQGKGAVDAGTITLGTGTYQADFDRDITACAAIGTPADETSFGISAREVTAVQRGGDTSALFVQVFNSAGTTINSAYTVVVICP